jgi:predicted Zn-dependent peptidase
VISARPIAGQSDAVLTAIQEEIERLAVAAPDPGELERAVRSLEGEQAVSQANGPGRAGALRNIELFHLADTYLDNYGGAYRAVKLEELKETAKRWFSRPAYATVLVEP